MAEANVGALFVGAVTTGVVVPLSDPPPPPEPMYLDVEDSYTKAEGLGRLGAVYDQDTDNMYAQTRGFKACQKGGQTLGNYQEVRIRHLHKRVSDYVGDQ